MMMPFRKTFARYVKVVVTNWVIFPQAIPAQVIKPGCL